MTSYNLHNLHLEIYAAAERKKAKERDKKEFKTHLIGCSYILYDGNKMILPIYMASQYYLYIIIYRVNTTS